MRALCNQSITMYGLSDNCGISDSSNNNIVNNNYSNTCPTSLGCAEYKISWYLKINFGYT